MLKCGQTNNKKYTFGLRKEQIDEEKKEYICKCEKCGGEYRVGSKHCSCCGAKIG